MLRLCTGMRSLGAVMPCKKGLQVPPPPAAVVAAAGAGTGAEQKGTEQKEEEEEVDTPAHSLVLLC
jgi:ribosomal protein L12E/L44/L45/RPP1/RPP2